MPRTGKPAARHVAAVERAVTVLDASVPEHVPLDLLTPRAAPEAIAA